MYRRRRKPWATASRSLGSGAAGVRACRLVALPDPDRATGSRPLIHSGSYRKQRVDRPSSRFGARCWIVPAHGVQAAAVEKEPND